MAGRASMVFAPYELLGALQARNVNLVVIGAFARIVRGTRELTRAIDITPSMRDENLARLEQALEDLDARRSDGAPLDLRSFEEPVTELATRAGALKLVPEPAGTRGYDDLRRRARHEPIGQGLRPQVASVDDHARMLSVLSRDEDRQPLRTVQRMIELGPEISRGLHRGIDI